MGCRFFVSWFVQGMERGHGHAGANEQNATDNDPLNAVQYEL